MIIGDGPLRSELEEYARELQIEASTVFMGRREDMPSAYAALDVVVVPSLFEGMPMVVLEALAAQRAMVATRVGAIPELVANNDTGLLVEAGDSNALESAILRLIVNPELRSELGLRGSMRVSEGFSAEGMAREYLKIYIDAGRDAVAG
jgi:glycosyltransferase involved in cell wall biosynthesis